MSSQMMSNRSEPFFISADPELTITTSAGADQCTVQFKKEMIFPPTAQNITLECNNATIWWTVLNIKTGINDQFQIEVQGDAVYTITIAPGIYGVSELNSAVNSLLINEGLNSGLITITGDNATQKILLSFSVAGLQVEWIAQSFFDLLGFNSGQLVPDPTFTTGDYTELAPNVANFSDISSFLLHTDLVKAGIPLGNRQSQAIANALITVPPGSLIPFQPENPIQLDVNHLRGQTINGATFWITDQLGNRGLDFNGEYFSMLLVIRYHVHNMGITHI